MTAMYAAERLQKVQHLLDLSNVVPRPLRSRRAGGLSKPRRVR